MVCMQSLDTPEAAFILTPWDEERLGELPKLNAEQKQCLELAPDSDLSWMVVLNPFADSEWVTANLKAPVALSISTHRGVQLIRPEPGFDLRYRWMPQPKQA
jgi:flagellar assembly factor FliW